MLKVRKICCFYKDILFQQWLCFPPFAQAVRGWEAKGAQGEQELSVSHIHNTCLRGTTLQGHLEAEAAALSQQNRERFPQNETHSLQLKRVICWERNQAFRVYFSGLSLGLPKREEWAK